MSVPVSRPTQKAQKFGLPLRGQSETSPCEALRRNSPVFLIVHRIQNPTTSLPSTAIESENRRVPSAPRNFEPDIAQPVPIALHYNGERSRDASTEEYDLAVIGITAPTHIRATARVISMGSGEDRPIDMVIAVANRILSAKARSKVRNLPELPDEVGVADRARADGRGDTPFVPLVISTGGMVEIDTAEKLKEWKRWGMTGAAHGWMMMSVAVRLARARARTFKAGE